MMERVKTFTLVLLVLLSLVQSYLLSYSMPNFEPIQRSESSYVKTEEMGPQEKVENLIYPSEMILHLGGGKHTIFTPDVIFYKEIFKKLQGRKFDGFQKASIHLIDSDTFRNQNQGYELVFGQGVSVTLLKKIFQIQGDALSGDEMINRIWIFMTGDNDAVRTLFFSSKGDTVYEATRADLSVQDVKQHVEFGQAMNTYHLLYGKYYVPDTPLSIVQAEIPFKEFSPEQMQRNLFADPTVTRNIQEKDGSQIYTDGKRSLQIKPDTKWVSYADPVARVDSKSDLSESVLSAVQFVNQHGGWNGTYLLSIPQGAADGSVVTFQQYYGAYPIMTNPKSTFHFGSITLNMQQGAVAGYERSLIHFEDEPVKKQLRTLSGGDELSGKLKRYMQEKQSSVDWLFPAYKAVLTDKAIRLIPVWAVRLNNGTIDFLE